MTRDEIAAVVQEAERLLADITPAPWAWEPIAEKSNEWAVGQAFREDGTPIEGRIPDDEWIEETVIERRGLVGMNESGHARFADAKFIAAAPRLIRSLLAALQAPASEPVSKLLRNPVRFIPKRACEGAPMVEGRCPHRDCSAKWGEVCRLSAHLSAPAERAPEPEQGR